MVVTKVQIVFSVQLVVILRPAFRGQLTIATLNLLWYGGIDDNEPH